MNLNEQIEKHEKAIKILLLIGECERLIEMHKISVDNNVNTHWNLHRKELNKRIKAKLERYYNSTFKIN